MNENSIVVVNGKKFAIQYSPAAKIYFVVCLDVVEKISLFATKNKKYAIGYMRELVDKKKTDDLSDFDM